MAQPLHMSDNFESNSVNGELEILLSDTDDCTSDGFAAINCQNKWLFDNLTKKNIW